MDRVNTAGEVSLVRSTSAARTTGCGCSPPTAGRGAIGEGEAAVAAFREDFEDGGS